MQAYFGWFSPNWYVPEILTLGELFNAKVKGQGQGHILCGFL